ncbi:MAG: 2'-5' RNA ligase family protein [Akkermansiaceae bacterium]|nr:2'-5' RNA ligase family protein [Akkermansiaceae bacterium]
MTEESAKRATESAPAHPNLITRARARFARLVAAGVATGGQPLLAVVIPMAGGAGNLAAQLQYEIHRSLRGVPAPDAWPHISIKLGFVAPDPERIAACLDEIGRSTEPFEIVLGGCDSFDEGILFIDVAKCDALETLRQRVLRDLDARFGIGRHPIEDQRFRFHVTLAHGMRGRTFAAAKAEFLARPFDQRFPARHLELLCHAGSHWITMARIPLGPANTLPQ